MQDLETFKTQLNHQLEEVNESLSKVSLDNNTTRALVKKQNDEFAVMYSHIEINKANLERLERSLEHLPVIASLEQTDIYLDKYLPFQIQNMIDETLIGVVGSLDVAKLIAYEDTAFKSFISNIKTKQSKLAKDQYYLPSKDQRQKLAVARETERLEHEAALKEQAMQRYRRNSRASHNRDMSSQKRYRSHHDLAEEQNSQSVHSQLEVDDYKPSSR